jgi:hypothetical protein
MDFSGSIYHSDMTDRIIREWELVNKRTNSLFFNYLQLTNFRFNPLHVTHEIPRWNIPPRVNVFGV